MIDKLAAFVFVLASAGMAVSIGMLALAAIGVLLTRR